MIRDFIISIFTLFVIDPFQAELDRRLIDARAPVEVVREVTACARAATPVLAERAMGDWWWGVTTTIGVAIGVTAPETVLRETTPACERAIALARPYLIRG